MQLSMILYQDVYDIVDGFIYRDQFVLYEDGYGNHVGRLKEMIIRGGENLFPKEIEYFLESHPSISQVQVIKYNKHTTIVLRI